MNQSRITAFIFDMDGVLTDTVSYHYRSWQRLAAELDIPFTRKDNDQLLGLSRPDSLKIFLQGRQVTDQEFQLLLQKKNDYFLELLKDFSPADLLPGVHSLLTALHQAGIKLAVASSSRNTAFILERLAIRRFFASVSDSNTIPIAKPAPDLFLDAAQRLEVPPEQCVVVEDSTAGVEAALKAGMRVVGIGERDLVSRANLFYPTMAEISIPEIFALSK